MTLIITILVFILLFLSLFVNVFLAIGLRNLLRKYEIYEDWVTYFRSGINEVNEKIKTADIAYTPDGNSYRIFEKDDEVGFIFSDISRIIDEFNEKVK